MRSGAPCNKCKSGKQAEGDSWCLGCSAQEVSLQALKRRWNNPGLRAIAEETLLSGARLVKAFANLDSNLVTAAAVDKSPLAAAKSQPERARSRSPRDDRPPIPRNFSTARSSDHRGQEGEDEEYTYAEESEEEYLEGDRPEEAEEPPRREVKEEDRGSAKPPEPKHPPSGRHYPEQQEQTERRRDKKDKKGKKKSKSGKKKRGGTRHQRHHRENTDPFRRSHRRYPQDGLRLASSLEEGLSRRA